MSYGFEKVEEEGGKLTEQSVEQESIINTMIVSYKDEEMKKRVKRGICLGWSAEWILHSSSSQSFWNYVNSSNGKADLTHMGLREQNNTGNELITKYMFSKNYDVKQMALYQEELKKAKTKNWAKELIESKRDWKGITTENKGGNADVTAELTKAIVAMNGYHLITLILSPQFGNHAVAASVQGDQVIYMDPNGGEAVFDTMKSFAIWFLTYHLKCYRAYGLNGYEIVCFPIQVNETIEREKYIPERNEVLPKRNEVNRMNRKQAGAIQRQAGSTKPTWMTEKKTQVSSTKPEWMTEKK